MSYEHEAVPIFRRNRPGPQNPQASQRNSPGNIEREISEVEALPVSRAMGKSVAQQNGLGRTCILVAAVEEISPRLNRPPSNTKCP